MYHIACYKQHNDAHDKGTNRIFTKTKNDYYLHNTHPLSSASMFLTIRIHLLVICSIGSIPETLPAARAFSLYSTNFSLWNIFWQYVQYQSPRGIVVKDAHSAQANKFAHHNLPKQTIINKGN